MMKTIRVFVSSPGDVRTERTIADRLVRMTAEEVGIPVSVQYSNLLRDAQVLESPNGGFCSYGVANGVLANIEGPDAFTVYKGKLYFCGNQSALKGFRSNIDSNIDKADTNWRQLNGS
jgi:hypothetical protein